MGKKKDKKRAQQEAAIRETMREAKAVGMPDTNGFVKVDVFADRRTAEIMARKPETKLLQHKDESDKDYSNRKAANDKARLEWERDVKENERMIKERATETVPVHIQQFRRAQGKDPLTGERPQIEHIEDEEDGEDG